MGLRPGAGPVGLISAEILTVRERVVLQLMAEGMTKKEIAAQAEISVHTVSSHLRSIYEKLQVNTNTGAVGRALRQGLI
jgi:two-component system response regulator NreC